jgi:hypothetical protein
MEGDAVVVQKLAQLPPVCVKCGRHDELTQRH